MSRKSVESSKKTYILSKKKKKTQKGQMFRSPSTVAGERSALESPLMEDECDRPGKSEERGRESEHSREWRTLCEPRHFCRFRFQAEGLSGWCKKKKKMSLTMRTNPSFCLLHSSPPPSVSLKSVWALQPAHRLFLLGRSL